MCYDVLLHSRVDVETKIKDTKFKATELTIWS